MTVDITGLSKTFRGGHKALDDIRLQFAPGEMVALIGASGSGKSTLLRHVAGLMAGDAADGHVQVEGATIQQRGRLGRDIRALRAGIGFVFQQFNLVSRMTVLDNVLCGGLGRMPLWRSCVRQFTRQERHAGLVALARVGIAAHAYKRASMLSGGQQQRAAIARAIVQRAKVVLADEPIASLDPESSRRVMQTLSELNRQDGTTVIVSLHQVEMALRYCPRTVALKQGRVVYDGPSTQLTPPMLRSLYGAEADDLLGMPPPSDAPPPSAQTAPATRARPLAAAL
ncbi:MAG: phosphonate ABC transporter ATP-binding protein [Burkholderiaceae bacterium]